MFAVETARLGLATFFPDGSSSGLSWSELLALGLVAILLVFLCYRHWQRVRHEIEPPGAGNWTGKGFDPSGIKPRIESVRKDYLAESHPPEPHFRRGLLAFAREAVSHLAFFQDRSHTSEPGSKAQPH
jgi:hypothetical protein